VITQNKFIRIILKAKVKTSTSLKSIQSDAESLLNMITADTVQRKRIKYIDVFNNYKSEKNYLLTLSKIRNTPIDSPNEKEKWMQFQLLRTVQSFIGEYKNYEDGIKTFESSRQIKVNDMLADGVYKNEEALRKIAEFSKDTRIVILNENHWYPNHRILASKVLKILKSEGYTYLAVEAVNKEKDSVFNKIGYPLRSTGYYVQEPFFGQFLREAKQLEYTVKGYDEEIIANREISQAKNIKKILDSNPKAKILVYAGVDHVLEDEKNKRMAFYLKKYTGIDPLTINQVELVGDSKEDIVLFPSSMFKEKSNNIKTGTDYLLLNNISRKYEDYYESIKEVKVTLKKVNKRQDKSKPCLVSVYMYDEYKTYKSGSVPIINKICFPIDDTIKIDLPRGNFWIDILDSSNQNLFTGNIKNMNMDVKHQ
ncbi:hypothetical protein AB832_06640, partial [Flavobacteriaceae bacterium (ex Bugula neritina AB1)]